MEAMVVATVVCTFFITISVLFSCMGGSRPMVCLRRPWHNKYGEGMAVCGNVRTFALFIEKG